MNRIVVGIDGSENAKAALRWALDVARRQGASVRAVEVWQYPYIAVAPSPIGTAVPPADLMQQSTEAALGDIVADVVTPDDVAVEQVVREGAPARVLLDEAKDADLLVVGARGHGGFAGLLLGSVATQLVHHARRPVAVIPAP